MKTRAFAVAAMLMGIGLNALASCSSSGDAAFSPAMDEGKERGPCRSDGSCDAGLECRSDLCVSAEGSSGSGGGQSMASGGTNTQPNGGTTMANGGESTMMSSGGDGNANNTGGMDSGQAGEPGAPAAGAGSGGSPNNVVCEGKHPNVADGIRYCNVGDCYCNDPWDTCFSADTAAACCEGTPRCGNEASQRGCGGGKHPIVGPPRTCESGSCLCSGDYNGNAPGGMVDVCLPMDRAASCCPPSIDLQCVE